MGLKNGLVQEFDVKANLAATTLVQSHWDGETWGLCMIEGSKRFITSGDDDLLLIYDIELRKVIGSGKVSNNEIKPKPLVNKRGASSLGHLPPFR